MPVPHPACRLFQLTMLALAVWAVLGCSGPESSAGRNHISEPQARLTLPERAPDALTGRAFMQGSSGFNPAERQEAALQEMLRGNIPGRLRTLAAVRLSTADGDTLVLWVLADYLSIGSDDDFIRMPLGLSAAQTIAARLHMCWPTPALVDAIYSQADMKLEPRPLPPGPEMRSNAYYQYHQDIIQQQILEQGGSYRLLAGHKKDLVAAQRMEREPDRVPIYGWHRLNGEPIQPLSLVHGGEYEDYSHGLRLVWPEARLNGDPVDLVEIAARGEWQYLFGGAAPARVCPAELF